MIEVASGWGGAVLVLPFKWIGSKVVDPDRERVGGTQQYVVVPASCDGLIAYEKAADE